MHEIDTRHHQRALANIAGVDASRSPTETPASRAALRVFGKDGALVKIIRNTYQEGLAKLQSNSFESKEAKIEWQEFVDSLTPEELAAATAKEWR